VTGAIVAGVTGAVLNGYPDTVGNLTLMAAPIVSGRTRLRSLHGAVGVIVLVAVLVAGCTTSLAGRGGAAITSTAPTTTSSATPSASPSSAKIKLSDCSKLFDLAGAGIASDRLKHLTFTCGKVPVPLDYSDPDSPTINIEVLRMHDDQQTNRIGSLLVNPGGPGASGLGLPISLAATVSDDLLQHFDLVGFDPRGVGLSSPVQCVPDAEKDQLYSLDINVLTPDGFAAAKQDEDQVAAECTVKYGPELADYNTVFTAMDMDRIRAAMGDAEMNYLGFSYGTELGAVYAHLYPSKVRVEVLDGAVDPTVSAVTFAGEQLAGFEDAFDQFAADCMTRPSCAVLKNPRQVVYDLVAKANVTPIPTPIKIGRTDETRSATAGNVLYGVLYALYNQKLWVDLGDALVAAQKGDASGLLSLSDGYTKRDSDGTYSNLFDANTTISCNDTPAGPTDALVKATATTWAADYPMFGVWGAMSLFSCQNWQPVRHVPPLPSATGSNPILVIGTAHDPATPYTGAANLAKTLTTGVLLTWDGEGHTAYTKTACIDEKVDAYLVDETLPDAGTTCPA
jgi:pimeloyl-ACP methyl ester carboxylesterase